MLKGSVQVPVRTRSVPAFVKLLTSREHAAESVCAWLAKALNLQAPEALWVEVPRNRIPTAVSWPYGNKEVQCCFGTVAVPHARSLNIAQLQQGILLQQLAHHLLVLARIAIFDEWVGNEDRHEGNILLSPTGVPLVIDHERTLGTGGGAELFSGSILRAPSNLLSLIERLPAKQRFEMRAPLLAFIAACREQVYQIPFEQLVPEDEALRRGMAQYLEHRVERLADVVSSVLGMSDLPGINDGPAIRPDL
ncbi:HipA family kinase [Ralstonia solanacearum]|uniref:HipA family kinase n=1 Tax=Ralstonia solanacearum TaxID=305 RepID=UPI002E1B2960